MSGHPRHFDAYVPRVASEWDEEAPGSLWRIVDGSLLFVDVSGFTNLSERLARKGRIGAEELTGVLNRVFGEMLDLVFNRGGSLLKFGGDALLLFFDVPDHAMQATAAAVEMRSALRRASNERTSVGKVNLKMSSGIHTGPVDFFLVGNSHRELIITGPTASMTTEMETTADANEIVVSQSMKDELPDHIAFAPKDHGWLLRTQKIDCPRCGPVERDSPTASTMSDYISTGLRDYLASGIAEPEHRISTIAFLKFKGVDHLLEHSGHDAVGEALDQLVTTVQEAADSESVTFLGSDIDADGGKLILTAGVPTSRHDDEGRMLRAARNILDTDTKLDVRIGLNRGHVFSGDVGNVYRRTYTVMGDTVNLAARLMAAAPSGHLYASPSVLERAATLYRTQALEPFHVKGKEQLVQAYEVLEETGVKPPDLEHDLPFHGRDAELEMIVQIVTTCARVGRGGMMTITGDTGLGKTRLLAEVLKECPGLATLMVQAEPNGTDNPYWAFRDPLRGMLGIDRAPQTEMVKQLEKAVSQTAPDILWALPLIGDLMHIEVPDNEETAAIDARFRPERAADVLIDLLSRIYTDPLAILAEDGHWIDDASANLLRRLGTAAETRPWTVILTARRERSDFEPLGDEVPLRPLDEESTRRIVIEATAAAPLRPHELDAIVAQAGGNPLFLSEILGMVRATGSADELPESLDAVVSTEIDTLPPLTRQLLRYSSVLGRSFRRVVLEEFLAPEDVALDAATQKDLERFIETDGSTRLRFRHSVVHDVAYQGLSYRRRRELHERAGEVIERLAGEEAEGVAEFLADHYSAAGNWEKTWRFSRVAADRAKSAYANTEAATHYLRAIEAAAQIDKAESSEVAELWKRLGVVREFTGQLEAAREAYLQALRMDGANPEREIDLRIRRADVWLNSRRIPQARREITLARKRLKGEDAKLAVKLRARLESFDSRVHIIAGDFRRARAAASKAIDLAHGSDEAEALARAYLVFDIANAFLDSGPPQYTQEAVGIYQELGMLERSAQAMSNLGAHAFLRGDWDEAVEWYEKSVKDSARAGDVVATAVMRINIAEVLIGQRHLDKAGQLLEEAGRVLQASNAKQWLILFELQRARLDVALDDPGRAVERLRGMFDEQLAGNRTDWTPHIGIHLADALVQAGQPELALDTLNKLEAEIPDLGDDIKAGISRLRGSVKVDRGELGDAERFFDQGLAVTEGPDTAYEELLIREERILMRDRAGVAPDPVDIQRVDQLRSLLQVEPLSALDRSPVS